MPHGEADVEAERVDEEVPDGPERDRAAEPLLDPDRRLDDARVAQAPRQDQELQVEGETALAQEGEDVGDDPPADQLDPNLRVLDVQAEQEVDEVLVAP